MSKSTVLSAKETSNVAKGKLEVFESTWTNKNTLVTLYLQLLWFQLVKI